MAFKKSGDVRSIGQPMTVKEAQEEAKKAKKRDKKDPKS